MIEPRRTNSSPICDQSDRLRLGHIRLGTPLDDHTNKTLSRTRGDSRTRLVAAMRRLEHRLHSIRTLLGLHSLPDSRQHGTLGHDGAHTRLTAVTHDQKDSQV